MTGSAESPFRILFVVNYGAARATNTAAGVFVDRQAQSLRDAGVEVSIFDIGSRYSPLAVLRSWHALRREIDRFRPDLLHAQYGTMVAFVSVLTFHPTVITFGGSDLQPAVAVSLVRRVAGVLLSNVAALMAKGLICVSEDLRCKLWWRREKAVVIPRGVDLTLFTPGVRDEARAILGWEPRRRVAVIDGGRDPLNKGVALAEAAVNVAKRTLHDLELWRIGGVAPEQMPLVYRAADVLICASIREGSPNVVKEALACALPVVSVRVGDVEERLSGVEPSALVERTPEAMAEGLVQVLAGGRYSNGPQAVAPLSQQRVAARIVAFYAAVLGDQRATGRPQSAAAMSVTVVNLRLDLVEAAVDVHLEAFAGYMNSQLGRRYVAAFLDWFRRTPSAIALVALVDGRVTGYVVGAPADYQRVMNRDLFWVTFGAFLARPWLWVQRRFLRQIAARARVTLAGRSERGNGDGSGVSLVGIGTARGAQGQGIGTALMNEFESRARHAGARSMRLSVYADNEKARRLYERSGWSVFHDDPASRLVYYQRSLS